MVVFGSSQISFLRGCADCEVTGGADRVYGAVGIVAVAIQVVPLDLRVSLRSSCLSERRGPR
jgi:hypothetical protein